ncbi:MAG TPA: hypothetical protein VEP90_07490 [Methylomirabilota bacterium]|nr:hypothetical protein [Methylomirabilota bacterium]
MQRVLNLLVIEASTKDGTNYSKKRIKQTIEHLENDGFVVKVKREVEK